MADEFTKVTLHFSLNQDGRPRELLACDQTVNSNCRRPVA